MLRVTVLLHCTKRGSQIIPHWRFWHSWQRHANLLVFSKKKQKNIKAKVKWSKTLNLVLAVKSPTINSKITRNQEDHFDRLMHFHCTNLFLWSIQLTGLISTSLHVPQPHVATSPWIRSLSSVGKWSHLHGWSCYNGIWHSWMCCSFNYYSCQK